MTDYHWGSILRWEEEFVTLFGCLPSFLRKRVYDGANKTKVK